MKEESAQTVPSVQDRSQEFVAVEGGPAQSSSAELLLTLAYALMWAAVFGLAIFTHRRQAKTLARLDELEKTLAERGGSE